jgi:hypothetical protein
MRKWVAKSLAVLLGVALFLGGLIALGRLALDGLRRQDRYTAAFADISCTPPPGLSRSDFLGEVQYLGSFPERLPVLDPELAPRLAEGFARHPWVAKVERVEILAAGKVRVLLTYRRPVLAVPAGGQVRVVDGQGILLPRGASAEGLPVFPGTARPPAGPAGSPWGDAGVESAARSADDKVTR